MRRFNISEPHFDYSGEDPEGFRSGRVKLAPQVGGDQLGASLYELGQNQAVCPYHYEYGEEEWLLVLGGHPTVRTPEGTEVLDPWDVVCFPRGPDGAHLIRNDSEDPARVLIFSSVVFPTATVYPDSDKIGIWTGNGQDDLIVKRESGVDYFEGESSR